MRDETSSGGLLANDCLVHYSVSSLPFGGVGEYTQWFFISTEMVLKTTFSLCGKRCMIQIYDSGVVSAVEQTSAQSLSLLLYFSHRKQRYGLLPRQVHFWPAEPPAQLSHQTAENGGGEQHAVSTSHAQETGLGSLLHPEQRRPGMDGEDGSFSRSGCGGCCCATG